MRTSGRLLRRRDSAEDLLAGYRRLEADPRTAGRVAGVLMICGLALAIEVVFAADILTEAPYDRGFYLTGVGLAVAGTLVAASVAVVTLLVGAADQLLDARRPLATLVAFGVEESVLIRVLTRRLSVAAVPAVMIGVVVGGALMGLSFGVEGGFSAWSYIGLFVVPLVLAALVFRCRCGRRCTARNPASALAVTRCDWPREPPRRVVAPRLEMHKTRDNVAQPRLPPQ